MTRGRFICHILISGEDRINSCLSLLFPKLFVKEYEDYLEKRILYERKQADEDIELRKRRFDN